MEDLARNWNLLLGLLPQDWQSEARELGAVSRLRGFDSVEALLRCLLLHVGCGYSLRETVTRAELAGFAQISDVTLLNRLRQASGWLQQMCLTLLREQGLPPECGLAGRRLRVLDGTHVREPGRTGTEWRIHYSIGLPDLNCDYFAITPVRGRGVHDRLSRFPAHPGELLLADRGFCQARELAAVVAQGADVLVRLGSNSAKLERPGGGRFDWRAHLHQVAIAGEARQWPVQIADPNGGPAVAGRLCVLRKSEEAIVRSRKRLARRATLQQHRTRAATYLAAEYVMVFTTLPAGQATPAQVLDCYRLRWQIELLFKRLKSLAALGHIPKHDEQSCHAWLYGKLLVALLSQKLARLARTFSPWGYTLAAAPDPKPLA
jgi:hypothetical protein